MDEEFYRMEGKALILDSQSLSIGIDVIDIDRFEGVLERKPRFLQRYFHQEELDSLKTRKNFARHLAGRFAAKEAIVKAMGTGFSGFSLKEIVVLNDKSGKPLVRLEGKALQVCKELGIEEFALSISFSKNTVVASAVAIKRKNNNG